MRLSFLLIALSAGLYNETSGAARAEVPTDPRVLALCTLVGDLARSAALSARTLGVPLYFRSPPECEIPTAVDPNDATEFRAIISSYARDIRKAILARGSRTLPLDLVIEVSEGCSAPWPKAGAVRLDQTEYKLNLIQGGLIFEGAVVEDSIVFQVVTESGVWPLYGAWTDGSALLTENEGKCQVVLREPGVTQLVDLGPATATIFTPDDYIIGYSQPGFVELVPEGQTIEAWNDLFTISILATTVAIAVNTITEIRLEAQKQFSEDCSSAITTTDYEVLIAGRVGFTSWLVFCENIKKGPSKGKIEVNLIRIGLVEQNVLFISRGFRYIPNSADVDYWRRFLQRATIKLK